MADTQSQLPKYSAATERTQTGFLRSLITVFKDNRDVLPDLPEMIECLIANEGDVLNKMNAAHVSSEENRIQLLEAELEEKRKEVIEKDKKMSEMEKDIEEKIQLLEAQLEEKRKEVIEKDKKMSKMEKNIEEKLQLAKEKEVEIQNLRDRYITSYRKLKAESEQRKEVISNMEQQHSQRLSKMTDELKDAYSKMDDYKSRLASLSEKRVKQDQRLVEDTLSLNRQSGLERDFSDFFDEERMDACDKMQAIYQNKEEDFLYILYPRLACIILESAYEKVKEVNEAAIDLFKGLTENMVKNAAQMGHHFCITRKLSIERKYHHDECTVPITVALWREASNYPNDTIDGLTLALKETADICNLDFLIYEVAHLAFGKWNKWIEEDETCLFTPAWHLLESLASYINASIRLAWRMVTQVPPMKLEYKIMKYDKRIHKKISRNRNLKDRPRNRFSAQQDQDEEIACYLWPGLQDGGGRQTRLGEVLCFV